MRVRVCVYARACTRVHDARVGGGARFSTRVCAWRARFLSLLTELTELT
jgi:hypothetical protein